MRKTNSGNLKATAYLRIVKTTKQTTAPSGAFLLPEIRMNRAQRADAQI